MFYRFESGNKGIYEAVDLDCPRTDPRRENKPDGSWLPKVGEKYPRAISFWTEKGVEKYFESGLQEWHRSVLKTSLNVLKLDQPKDVLYEDEFQVICDANQELVSESWEDFVISQKEFPLVDKVVAYITREEEGNLEILVFDHEKEWSEAGTQVPAGGIDDGEDLEAGVLREVLEEVGIKDIKISKKIDEYIMYRNTHKQFNRRHVFHLKPTCELPKNWTHTVSGEGIDKDMKFYCYWIPINEAEIKLAGSMGHSIRKLKT